jgi:pimeloyl-ACP methyl ester carboxylesterase
LGEGHTFVRYDERGCGLSDRAPGELSLDRWVADLESVVDAAGSSMVSLPESSVRAGEFGSAPSPR